MTQRSDFPNAPASAYIEGDWLIVGDEGYTVAEWVSAQVPSSRQIEIAQAYQELGESRAVAERFGLAQQTVRNAVCRYRRSAL